MIFLRLGFICCLLFFGTASAQKNNCELSWHADHAQINGTGKLVLSVKNTGKTKVKVLADFSSYRVQLLHIEKYDAKNKKWIPQNLGFNDIDFMMNEKMKLLSPGQSKIYMLNIFETSQGKSLSRNGTYRFNLSFDFYDLTDCGLKGL